MGLKYPSLDPVCLVMDCAVFSQQYLAVHITLRECVYADTATHKGGSCRWRYKGQDTTAYFYFCFSFSVNSLALLLLLKKEALNTALLLLLSHFPIKLDF